MRIREFTGFFGERGVTSIEFAIVLPVLLLIAFGLIDLGRAIWTQTTLDYAVQAAARCAAVDIGTTANPGTCGTNGAADSAKIQSYAASQAYGLSPPSGAFTYTAGATCGTGVTGAKVAASFTFTYFFPPFASFSGPFTSFACYPV